MNIKGSHVVCMQQFATLHETANKIAAELLDPQDALDYHAWVHREEPFLLEEHVKQRDAMEQAWHGRFAAAENDAMSQLPDYIACDDAATMWDATALLRRRSACRSLPI